jgi:ATP-dependent protease ClpP protease subunit
MDNQFHQGQLTKPLNGQATYQKSLAHLIWMAGLKGAKQYAWQRAKQLDADPSGMYRGIADDLTKAMNEIRKD